MQDYQIEELVDRGLDLFERYVKAYERSLDKGEKQSADLIKGLLGSVKPFPKKDK